MAREKIQKTPALQHAQLWKKNKGNKLTCRTEQMLIRQEESAGARVKLVTAGESQHDSHQKIPTRAPPVTQKQPVMQPYL